MASTPGFATTINVGAGTAPATLDTSLTAPSNTTTIFTAASSGSRVDEIRTVGLGTTSAGVVNVFLVRSGTFHLIDQILLTAVTSSTTAVAFKDVRQYSNLVLKSGDTLAVATTIAGNQSMTKHTALGADY